MANNSSHLDPALVEPARTSLVIIDMQNDFCAPGGYIDTVMRKDVSAGKAILPAIQHLIDSARQAGVPVIWIASDYRPEVIPASMQRKLKQRGITAICCEPDTWGADWFELNPQSNEPIVIKHSYSGFSGTQLHTLLQELNVQNLVFTGVQTQVCVESTLREAHALGYTNIVPDDAVGSHTPDLHQATLKNVHFLFGEVSNSTEIASYWQS